MTESDGTHARSAPKIFGLQPPKNLEKSLDLEQSSSIFRIKNRYLFVIISSYIPDAVNTNKTCNLGEIFKDISPNLFPRNLQFVLKSL